VCNARCCCAKVGAPACAACGCTYFLDNGSKNGCTRMCPMRVHNSLDTLSQCHNVRLTQCHIVQKVVHSHVAHASDQSTQHFVLCTRVAVHTCCCAHVLLCTRVVVHTCLWNTCCCDVAVTWRARKVVRSHVSHASAPLFVHAHVSTTENEKWVRPHGAHASAPTLRARHVFTTTRVPHATKPTFWTQEATCGHS
jgi:hypothetical protein